MVWCDLRGVSQPAVWHEIFMTACVRITWRSSNLFYCWYTWITQMTYLGSKTANFAKRRHALRCISSSDLTWFNIFATRLTAPSKKISGLSLELDQYSNDSHNHTKIICHKMMDAFTKELSPYIEPIKVKIWIPDGFFCRQIYYWPFTTCFSACCVASQPKIQPKQKGRRRASDQQADIQD